MVFSLSATNTKGFTGSVSRINWSNMADVEKLVQLMQQQMNAHQNQIEALVNRPGAPTSGSASTSPLLHLPQLYYVRPHFGALEGLPDAVWYFCWANDISKDRIAQILPTNETISVYMLFDTLASRKKPTKYINAFTMEYISKSMHSLYDPKRFSVRERFKFWSSLQRKPGESIHELATRIRQEAATCDFVSMKDSQDEAICTRFICSVGNEVVVKAFFLS